MYQAIIENPKGERIDLTADNDLVLCEIVGIYGFTNSINKYQIAGKHGSLYASTYTEARNISLSFALQNEPELQRIKLYKYFQREGELKFWYRSKYRNVYINGHVQDVTINVHTNPVEAVVILECPEPFFNASEETIVVFNERIPLLTFPFDTDLDNPIEFSKIGLVDSKNLYNPGEVENGVIIKFIATGGIVNAPKLLNVNTNEYIGVDYELQPNDQIVIDTRYGEKTVKLIRSGAETDLLNYIMEDITWFNIKLGDNIFYKSATSGNEYLNVQFNYNPQYNGV